MTQPRLALQEAGTGEVHHVSPGRLVVAGYTASDQEAVARHVEELARIGVPPPAAVPAFYDLDPTLLTNDAVVGVPGPDTSGEVEPVIIRHHGIYFLGVGSDHTDRKREREDVAASKAACPKPLGTTVIRVGTDLSQLSWGQIAAESIADGVPYQQSRCAALLHPAETLRRMPDKLNAPDIVLFCGTFPLLADSFAYATSWRLRLTFPDATVLEHRYDTNQRRS